MCFSEPTQAINPIIFSKEVLLIYAASHMQLHAFSTRGCNKRRQAVRKPEH